MLRASSFLYLTGYCASAVEFVFATEKRMIILLFFMTISLLSVNSLLIGQ